MNQQFQKIRETVAQLKEKLGSAEGELSYAERNCHHNWSKIEPDHIYHKGYEIPGDAPGTMGIDWRGPVWVEAKTEKRWKRTCQTCGMVEYTTRTKEEVTEHPTFD